VDELDRALINSLQGGFPLSERPFVEAAARLGCDEATLIARIGGLLQQGTLTRFGPLFDAAALGGAFTLCAMQVPAERFERVAETVNALAEVAHNYQRDHALNMWFVLATEKPEGIAAAIRRIEAATGLEVLDFPKLDEYFVELRLTA